MRRDHLAVGSSERTLEILRYLMLSVLAFALAGIGTELLMTGHTQEWTQWLPVVAVGVALIAVGLVALRPSRPAIQLFRGLMSLLIVVGVVGLILHYRGNAEFELEMRPSMAGFELIWNSLTGATPALAAGSLIPLGLLGLIGTFRLPAARADTAGGSNPDEAQR